MRLLRVAMLLVLERAGPQNHTSAANKRTPHHEGNRALLEGKLLPKLYDQTSSNKNQRKDIRKTIRMSLNGVNQVLQDAHGDRGRHGLRHPWQVGWPWIRIF